MLKNNPLADNSVPEILVDNDDDAHISLNGEWKKEMNGGYGPSLLIHTGTSPATARFTPAIQQSGKYNIYFYYPGKAGSPGSLPVKIFDGNKTIQKAIDRNNIKVVGQTTGEWVFLATATLPAGKKAYVEVSGQGTADNVVADAVLFVPLQTAQ